MDPKQAQESSGRDQLWASLRALRPEIDRLDAGEGEPDERQRAQPDPRRNDDPEIPAEAEVEPGRQDCGEIGADPEIGGLAERGQAGEAQQQVDAHRQDRENQGARDQQDQERRGMRDYKTKRDRQPSAQASAKGTHAESIVHDEGRDAR